MKLVDSTYEGKAIYIIFDDMNGNGVFIGHVVKNNRGKFVAQMYQDCPIDVTEVLEIAELMSNLERGSMFQVRTKDFGGHTKFTLVDTPEAAALLLVQEAKEVNHSIKVLEVFEDDSTKLLVELVRTVPGANFIFKKHWSL